MRRSRSVLGMGAKCPGGGGGPSRTQASTACMAYALLHPLLLSPPPQQDFLEACERKPVQVQSASQEACGALLCLRALTAEPGSADAAASPAVAASAASSGSPLPEEGLQCILEVIIKPAAARVLDPTLPGAAAAAGTADTRRRAAAVMEVQLAFVELVRWLHRSSRALAGHDAIMGKTMAIIAQLVEYPYWYGLVDKSNKEDYEARKAAKKELTKRLAVPPPDKHPLARKHKTLVPAASTAVPSASAEGTAGAAAGSSSSSSNRSSGPVHFFPYLMGILMAVPRQSPESRATAAWLAVELLRCADPKVQAALAPPPPSLSPSPAWALVPPPPSLGDLDCWAPMWRMWLDPHVAVAVGAGSFPLPADPDGLLYGGEVLLPMSVSAKQEVTVTWSDGTETRQPAGAGRRLARDAQGLACWGALVQAALGAVLQASQPAGVDASTEGIAEAPILRSLAAELAALPTPPTQIGDSAAAAATCNDSGSLEKPEQAQPAALARVRREHVLSALVSCLLPFLTGQRLAVAAHVLTELLPAAAPWLAGEVVTLYGEITEAAAAARGRAASGVSVPMPMVLLRAPAVMPEVSAMMELWAAQGAPFHHQWVPRLLTALLGPLAAADAQQRSAAATAPVPGAHASVYALPLLLRSALMSPAIALGCLTVEALDELLRLCSTWSPSASTAAAATPAAATENVCPAAMLTELLCAIAATAASDSGPPVPKEHRAKAVAILLHAVCATASDPAASSSAAAGGAVGGASADAAGKQQLLTVALVQVTADRSAVEEWQGSLLAPTAPGQQSPASAATAAEEVAAVLATAAAAALAPGSFGTSSIHGAAAAAAVTGETATLLLRASRALAAGPLALSLRRALVAHNQAVALSSLQHLLDAALMDRASISAAAVSDLIVPLMMQLCGAATLLPSAAVAASPHVPLPPTVRTAVLRLLAPEQLPAVVAAGASLGGVELEGWVAAVLASALPTAVDAGERSHLPVGMAAADFFDAVIRVCSGEPGAGGLAGTRASALGAAAHLATMARVLSHCPSPWSPSTSSQASADANQHLQVDTTSNGAGSSSRWRCLDSSLPALVRLRATSTSRDVQRSCCELLVVLLQLGESDRQALMRPWSSGWIPPTATTEAGAKCGPSNGANSAAAGGSSAPFLCAETGQRNRQLPPVVRSEDFDLALATLQAQMLQPSATAPATAAQQDGTASSARVPSDLILTPTTQRNVQLIREAAESGVPLLLSGDTGVGKTATVAHVAASLGRKLVRFNLSSKVGVRSCAAPSVPCEGRLRAYVRRAFERGYSFLPVKPYYLHCHQIFWRVVVAGDDARPDRAAAAQGQGHQQRCAGRRPGGGAGDGAAAFRRRLQPGPLAAA